MLGDCFELFQSQEKRQGPRFAVSSERLSPEIDILIWSPIQALTEPKCCLTQLYLTIDGISMPITAVKGRKDQSLVMSFFI